MDYSVNIKESKTIDKYLDLVKDLKKLYNINTAVIYF